MPRIARAIATGFPHHITQRGNYRQNIFESKVDYLKYLDWLKTYSRKYSLKIWAYCLMKNHVHFIAVPMEADSMARAFNTLHMRYSQYFNKKHSTTGHLWQGRFYSCVLDEIHLFAGIRYVENNPVRAGVVKRADEYRWSSARNHVQRKSDPVLSDDCYLLEKIKDWSAYLEEREDVALVEALRRNTLTGRPCGNDAFVLKIEEMLNRKLIALPRGRPRKAK